MYWRVLCFCIAIMIPQGVGAAVIINEVAWMGSTDSANDEWIELYNSGSTADVSGWTLSDGAALTITLEGTIGANEYAVLERTDDSTAPGTAFLIYTGALANDGRTLTLKRADGGIEDQVAGGTDWNDIGGDNTTKETAQLTSKGWVTGASTPGRVNVSEGSVPDGEEEETESEENDDNKEEETSTKTKTDGGRNQHISLALPAGELTLSITAPKTTFVNQRTPMFVTPSGISDKLTPSLQYRWNFGNLTLATGTEVGVTYTEPGEYVVIVDGRYARHEARGRHTVTVLPTPLSLARSDTGALLIHNDAQYEVDISNFTLSGDGNAKRTIPDATYLAPKASLTVSDKTFAGSRIVSLKDKRGEVVATLFPESLQKIVEEAVLPQEIVTSSFAAPVTAVASPEPKISALAISEPMPLALPAETQTEPQLASALMAGIPAEKIPYLGLIGLIMLGTFAIYTQKRQSLPE